MVLFFTLVPTFCPKTPNLLQPAQNPRIPNRSHRVMASHHHHHHQTTTCCSSCSLNPCCNQQPPPSQTDPLLQALASLLLQQQQQEAPHSPNQTHYQHRRFRQQNSYFNQQEQHRQQDVHCVVSSLLRRIDALESSFQHFSACKSYSSCSLRDAAARVIQTHFRAFLVRRSKTLRQLKELAFIKSSFSSLKLSISSKTHFDIEAVSQKAMDLLLKLDSIQGADPMIRDGKRSISRELVQLLDYIDDFVSKGNKFLCRTSKNVSFVSNVNKSRVLGTNSGETGGDRREIIKKLRSHVQKNSGCRKISRNEDEDVVELEGFHQIINDAEQPRISGKNGVFISQNRNGDLVKRQESQPRVKKSVTFAENGNVYRFVSNGQTNELSSSGDGTLTDDSVSSDDHGEITENLCKEFKGLAEDNEDEEAHLENEEYLHSSDDGERSTKRTVEDENSLLFAPLPLKMESGVDLKKRKAVKIVT